MFYHSQGNLVLKDFDIQKEAGKVSFKAVRKEFRTQVLENYLEVHLFWAGKGTCCIPDQFTYGPLISTLSAIPDFIPSVSNKPPSPPTSKKKKTDLTVKIALGVGLPIIFSVFAVCFVIQRRRRHVNENEELLGIEGKSNTFTYSELKNATNDFDSANKLGEGGFGPVYKAWNLYVNDNEIELVDSRLAEFDEIEVKRVVGISLLCTQASPILRPSMSRIVAMLSGDVEVTRVTSKPVYLAYMSFDDVTDLVNTDNGIDASYRRSANTSIRGEIST
ncbi:Protein kinase-like domain superfamily [Sesbania bispinosa]|nr:Protein kinase-like domain superfamily [Sesbania bispinosa]